VKEVSCAQRLPTCSAGVNVNLTGISGSIPVTLDFANILNLNVLLLPVGRGDDGEWLAPPQRF
jgi:hypothetical protein